MAALVFRNDFGDVPPQLRNESFLITESKLSEFGVLKSSTTGCWSQHESELRNCGTSGTCTMKRTVRSGGDGLQFVMFCCCDTHNCNRNWTHEPEIEEVGMLSTPMRKCLAFNFILLCFNKKFSPALGYDQLFRHSTLLPRMAHFPSAR